MVTINNYKHHKQQKSSNTNANTHHIITGTPGVGWQGKINSTKLPLSNSGGANTQAAGSCLAQGKPRASAGACWFWGQTSQKFIW